MDKINIKEEILSINEYWEELSKRESELINELLREKIDYILKIN